ncbi:MAG: TetR/AcrR family transcriptional regulator [Anaerovoracaceae bacterium]|jgi:AcrR family transcriptional regulator|nr:TetR/AcrR family transcriptional regulator [Anaerovoracaceae bacterium]
MNQPKIDRRIRRTRLLLREALIQLLLEKDIKEISILELTDKADVNRGTFYLHYKDIYDIYEQIENEILEEFRVIFEKRCRKENQVVLLPIVLEAFEFLAKNIDISIIILSSSDSDFLSRLINMGKPKEKEEWQALFGEMDEDLYEYYYSFITSGFVGLLRTWLNEGRKETPKKMGELAGMMMEKVCAPNN